SFRRRRLRPARAGDRLDPPARPAGGRRADLAALPRRRRGRLRQRRQLGAVAPRGLHLHQPGPHHLPPPDAGRRVGLPRGRDLAALLAFWFARGFDRLDQTVRGLGFDLIATGLVFLGALGAARLVLALLFRWWSTFVIEERFAFNRTTPRTFWTDVVKDGLLALVLGGPLLAAVLWLFAAAGA